MKSSIYLKTKAAALLLLSCSLASAQDKAIVTVASPSRQTVQHGSTATVELPLEVARGYHINGDKPLDEFLIPLKLTWDKGVLDGIEIAFPPPTLEKYEFSDKPLAVLTGRVTIKTTGKVTATPGAATLTGKLRYQGCSEKVCYPPKTLPISVPLDIK